LATIVSYMTSSVPGPRLDNLRWPQLATAIACDLLVRRDLAQ